MSRVKLARISFLSRRNEAAKLYESYVKKAMRLEPLAAYSILSSIADGQCT
jgi:hypothetical protein